MQAEAEAVAGAGAGGREQQPLFGEKEEIQILLKRIEEISKEARNVLLVLSTLSAYLLIASFGSAPAQAGGGQSNAIKLPLVDISVSEGTFFFTAPLIVLLIYACLHIYLCELRGCIRSYKDLAKSRPLFRRGAALAIYPWIVTLCEEGNRWSRALGFAASRLIGPIVLLALWVSFLVSSSTRALVPAFSLAISIVIALEDLKSVRGRRVNTILRFFAVMMIVSATTNYVGMPWLESSGRLSPWLAGYLKASRGGNGAVLAYFGYEGAGRIYTIVERAGAVIGVLWAGVWLLGILIKKRQSKRGAEAAAAAPPDPGA